MALFKLKRTKTGYNKVKISSREAKAYVMKINNWTSDEYRKKYDIFKNKLKAYESFKSAKGGIVKPQSTAELLYKQAKAKERARKAGETYKPSAEMERIQSFTAVSITKGRTLAKTSSSYRERRGKTFERTTDFVFKDLIDKNPKAKEIAESITDPVKREEALKAYAKALHAKIDEQGKVSDSEAFPQGETMGSDVSIDFDYSSYL